MHSTGLAPVRAAVRAIVALCAVWAALAAVSGPAHAGFFATASEKRAQVDAFAEETIDRLMRESPKAKELFTRSVGYAVFDATKISLFITGGGGTGVVVERGTGERTYMHMGVGGLNLGIGGQVLRMVFLFADTHTMDRFKDGGWDAGAGGAAVAGRFSRSAEASFVNGVAVYQLTDAGLLLVAELTGTKFWRSRKLNVPPELRTDSK